MKKKFFLCLIVVLSVSFSLPIFSNPAKQARKRLFFKNNQAKLYKALKLIDNRKNWLKVSELLREVLASGVDEPFIVDQLSVAKRTIDKEVYKNIFRERVLDWPFVVAKLRIMEAMMANHPRLNVSYDREVPLVKGLMQSYFFPGHEEQGEIVFPKAKTYRYDIYGYLKKNILKTETAPSGVIEDPRFPQKEGRGKKKKKRSDRNAELASAPENIERDLKLIKETLQKSSDLWDSTWEDIEDLINTVRRVDQYEKWALLLVGITNPDAQIHDPQLRDFMKGVKLKLKVGTYDWDPNQQYLLKEALKSSAGVGLEMQEDIDSTTGKVSLYVLANLASPEVLSLRVFIYFKKFMDFSQSVRAQRDAAVVVKISETLTKMGETLARWKTAEFPAQANRWLVFRHYAARWTGKIGRGLLGSESVFSQLARWERFQNMLTKVRTNRVFSALAKNDRYFKIVIGLVMAMDLAEGIVRVVGARDGYDVIDAVKHTTSREAATALYILPLISQKAIYKWLSFGAFGLDIGHWINPTIPRTSEVIHTVVYDWALDGGMGLVYKSFKQMLVEDYEKKIGIKSDEMSNALLTFKEVVQRSKNDAELILADEIVGEQIRDYANKRLFMIYFLLQRWDNKSVQEMGVTERRYWKNYRSYQKGLAQARLLYAQKMKGYVKDEKKRNEIRNELLRKLRKRRAERRAEAEASKSSTAPVDSKAGTAPVDSTSK